MDDEISEKEHYVDPQEVEDWIKNHPILAIGLGFLGGYILAKLIKGD